MACGQTSNAASTVEGQCDPECINVMFLCDEWKSSKGGLSTFNRELAVNLAKTSSRSERFKVHCYVSQSDERCREDAKQHGVNLITAKKIPGSSDPLDWLKIPPSELPHPDVVIGHGRKFGTPAFFIVQAAKCKWVHFVHVFCEDLGKYKVAESAARDVIEENEKKHKNEIELCKVANLVVSVGSRLQQKYSRNLPNLKVEIITPGITEKFCNEPSQLAKDRTVGKNWKFNVFMFGRATFEDLTLKGYDIVANAIGSLGRNFELTFVGASVGEHTKIQQWFLDKTCGKLTLNQVTIRSYCNEQGDLGTMFQQSDLVAVPSRTEGFGLVALEAISAGIPVLVTSESGIAEALQEVEGGKSVIVESDDAKEWEQRIKQLSSQSPEERQGNAKLLRENYNKRYSWSAECERFKSMIQDLVESSNALKIKIDVETIKPAEHKNTQDRTPVSVVESEGPQIGGYPEMVAVPVTSEHTQPPSTGAEALQAPNRILSEEELFRLIASNYLLTTPPKSKNERDDFLTYLKEVRVTIKGVSVGSLLITVKCDSLEVLERLWEDYISGHLGKVVQKCFVTEEILKELNLSELKLKTTISEEEYKACKAYFEKVSVKELKELNLAELKHETTISEEEYKEYQASVCSIQTVSPDDSPDEDESQTSDSGFSECSSIDRYLGEDQPAGVSGLSKIPHGVFVVCDHFLQDNRRKPESVHAGVKTCKFCEQRGRLKYATWNNERYHWQEMRPYPVQKIPPGAALAVCRHFSTDRPCLKEPCTFPHGKQETIMWTLERDGLLPTPYETLTGSSGNMPSTSTLSYRPSPPGVTNGSYKLCRSYFTHERCRFGRGCIFAHSKEELDEWKQEYDRKETEKLKKESEEKGEVWSLKMSSKILKGPAQDLVECLPGVALTCTPPDLNIKLQDKDDTHKYQWSFNLTFETNEVGYLEKVLLLHRYHNCYQLSEIRVSCYQDESYKLCYTTKLKDSWYQSPATNRPSGRVEISLTVSFESSLYGSFDQVVLFDFGKKPYLVQKLNADVMSEALSHTPIVLEHATASAQAIWEENSMEVVRFVHGTSEALQAEHLSRTYRLPKQVEITSETLNPNSYKRIMHQLLFVEEGFMRDEILCYTLNGTHLHAQRNISDEITGMKCVVDGELFGVLHLQKEDALRPDDAAGRLLYRNVSSVWLQLAESVSNKVHEAPVEKMESESVVLRLSSKMCSDLNLYDTCDAAVNAQFQLNRWPLCQMHAAVDRLTKGQLRLIFPEPRTETVKSQITIRWNWLVDDRLNANQKKVIERIASPEYNAPPLVVFGPFGTGKTFTLYQAVRLLVQVDKSHRILLCTHSNRAADLHVELLHDYLTNKNGTPAAKPLRVYQPMRRLETASEIARKYCLIKDGMFVLPSRDDLVEHRVVVTTLSTSQVLLDLRVLHGFFTHILIDEAAQALEPEALTPLIFAGPNTKVVFTGDHMQMSPEVYSPQAISLGLQTSLAERLFDVYEKQKAVASNFNSREDTNVLFLTENYRCHQDILQFSSDNFYGEKLVARGHQPAHPKYGPLLFFSARGKEKKEHDNSYINLSEVYEVVKRVEEIANSWPSIWGPKKLSDIAVLASYRYQVRAIRNSLRKKDLTDVKVDTIHNVQGEQFRVLFISTVRTFHTCKPQQEELRSSGSDRQLYWEFLSDPKLLNTAVTRAKCLVAVVGDPVSLCTVGECRSLWRDYIKRCNDRGGLHGTTVEELDKEINASIASIELNPKAQPFVPMNLQTPEESYTIDVSGGKKEEDDQENLEEKRQVESAGEAQPLERYGNKSYHQPEMSGNATESDSWDENNYLCVSITAQDHEEKEEEEADDEIAESGDFQDNLLEDETIFPRNMDDIISAFVKKCEETSQIGAQRTSMFKESDFPTLEATKDIKHQLVEEEQHVPFKSGADIKDLFPEVRVVNGRVEVRLTNIGFHTSPSEKARQIMISSKQQEFLDPSFLLRLLEEEPQKYVVCNLRLSPEKSQVGYAEIEDTKTPAIHIKGRIRQAFDKDKVVVELAKKKLRSKAEDSEPPVQGKVVGVLEHMISPHEREFVCTTDYENPALMVPINKSATKLVYLTDKSCKDIPIYKKDQNERATKVRMMKREKVLSGKFLFVVKYLQWRRDCSYPLGIVVRTLPRGEDLKSSMEIAYAEHGIRRVFKEETKKYVKDKFPPEWSIPETERRNRTKVAKAITIDSPTSLDLDDALTIERASPSTFVVGIHIADVSFFVKPNSPLDHEAFLRCTSYYPGEGQENVPMLPRELSENLCSLLPNEDRLAVSVFVTLDKEGRIAGEPSIERTIVRSCCRLSYAEAQMVIRGSSVSSTGHIPEEIVEKIMQLSSLAQKRRFLHLGDAALDHWQNSGSGECFEAHELVEEMMTLANEEIAKLLSQKSSELAPLRIQLPPKDHQRTEWIEMHGKYARLSLKFSDMFKNETTESSPLKSLHDERTTFKIQRSVWTAICQAVESSDLPRLYHLICNENNHPQLAAAMSHFRRIQSEARYVCKGDQPRSKNIFNYSLGMRCYTHFTSPIRRYIDIVVHRLLLGLQSGSGYAVDDITKVCRRSTFMQDNKQTFDKNCKRIHMANQLQQRCRETRVFVESMDHQSISLHISNQEDDHLASNQKRVLLSHLNPVALREEEESEEEKIIVLKWKFRKYVAPDATISNPDYDGIAKVAEIPSNIWLQVLDAVRAKDEEKLTTIITQTEAKMGIMSSMHAQDEPTQTTSPPNVVGVPYKHPRQNEEEASVFEEPVDHFYEKTITLRRYDFVSVQLCPHVTGGILQPDIQLFKVNTHLNICIEHRRYPRESFAHAARHQASRERYGTIDEYIRVWKPVLAMEAAMEAVHENDGFVIEELNVKWERKLEEDTVSGSFSLPSRYCGRRELSFYLGDLVCIRVPYCDTIMVSDDGTSKQAKPCPDIPHFGENKRASDCWVAHCIIKNEAHKEEVKTVEVIFEVHQTSSNIPDWLTNGDSRRSTLELIHRTLPQRRMYEALCSKLKDSSELVHAICKGEEPPEETFGDEPPANLFLVQHGFQTLNLYQENAVKAALSEPFTLIQGPPGTGKTITGVHIAYWFAERNKKLKPYKVLEKDTGESDYDGTHKAPPQVIYCGPSNKSVDVVTEYLLRIPNLKVLRVFSDQIEQKEFPIPNKLKPARTTRSDEELKISSDKIRHVSLHRVIRRPKCPHSQKLRQFEEGFAQSKAQGKKISPEKVTQYCQLIELAKMWALQESGVQIILCTCVVSGSATITTSCDNIQQCIVDECGMCMEPESLVPITCSGVKQVVLIGDHKQLQPVIQDHVAKTLGLSVSMFERHSERARMLKLQYRMHEGICEFPSKQFYGKKLQTADVVKSRDPSPVTFWPALLRQQSNLPIVFCHVEGKEESTAITTAESNEGSKRNMKEVKKAVQVAKYLVNRYGPRVRMSDVVILSPYREQRSKITEFLKGAYDDIQVTTVTKSQGSEWDYVIISLVRSLKRDEIDPEPSLSWLREHLGFLTDEHQMNVGLTRARRGLCIIGNKHLLGMDPMWKSLLQHYEENLCLVDESWP
ncbi:3'-5' exoribonuclease HELZ2-like isoform X2 [Oculina patagonica]